MKDSKKVVLAFSGGLDTTYCAVYLSSVLKLEVHAALVNTGGFTPEEIAAVEQKATKLGVASFTCLEQTEAYYNHIIKYLIFGNVLKNNTYPLSVSAERVHQSIALAEYAKEIGADSIAHGSTGAGNDQVRFDMAFSLLAPTLNIITPIRDNKLSRQQEIDFLKSHGVTMEWEKAKYSVNKGLWGTSVGGAETLTSHLPLPEEAFPSQVKETNPVTVKLHFEKGELKGINDQSLSPVKAIQLLDKIASKYGIGRDIHVGDTIIGIKGRVGFEAAAPAIIIKAHHLLEKHTLSKWQLHWKEQLASWYGMFVHESQYLEPVMRDIEVFLQNTQATVSGTVEVKLYPYRFELLGITSDNDLMKSGFGDYGEMNNQWSGDDVKGFTKLLANPLKIYNHVNKKS